MTGLRVLLRKELVEQWRTMRLPSFLAVFFFIGVASPAAARYLPKLMEAIGGASFAAAFPTPTIVDAYGQLSKNVAQIGALVVVLISMTAVSSERERGTLAFIFSKPVARASFFTAKLAALAVTIGLGMLVASLVDYAYTTLLFTAPGVGFALLCVVSLLTLLVFGAITLAVGAITGSAVAAGGAGVAGLILFGALSMFPNVGAYTPAGAVARAVEVAMGGGADGLIGPLLAQFAIVLVAWAAGQAVLARQEV